jgi:phosphoenolpyruvate carboxykinase (GTP)
MECVGDDIAWIHIKPNGQMVAINPENGFFGVAPGTNIDSNPNAMATIESNTYFTNVALTPEGDVWWEGMTKNPPNHLTDWKGNPWTPSSPDKAAHPNSRFTVSAANSPIIDPRWEDPNGVDISAIMFGGRRAEKVPLVYQSKSWQHGVFMGSSVTSETTAAAAGELGKIRHDPFAMLPFCGYNMADYFGHWLKMGIGKDGKPLPNLPKFYYVNWFRKEGDKFLWPGYGENMRVLKWMFERKPNDSIETPLGMVPSPGSLDLQDLRIPPQNMSKLLTVNPGEWREEVDGLKKFYTKFGDKIPSGLWQEFDSLNKRVEM